MSIQLKNILCLSTLCHNTILSSIFRKCFAFVFGISSFPKNRKYFISIPSTKKCKKCKKCFFFKFFFKTRKITAIYFEFGVCNLKLPLCFKMASSSTQMLRFRFRFRLLLLKCLVNKNALNKCIHF